MYNALNYYYKKVNTSGSLGQDVKDGTSNNLIDHDS